MTNKSAALFGFKSQHEERMKQMGQLIAILGGKRANKRKRAAKCDGTSSDSE